MSVYCVSVCLAAFIMYIYIYIKEMHVGVFIETLCTCFALL